LEFEDYWTPRIGIIGEVILPFHNNKWGIGIEPNFQYHNLEQSFNYRFTIGETAKTKYTTIETLITLRHYIYLNKKNKIFLNASYILDIPIKSKMDYNARRDLKIAISSNFALGAGMEFNDRYNFEIRYGFQRDLLNRYTFDANYSLASFIIGYNFVKITSKNKATK